MYFFCAPICAANALEGMLSVLQCARWFKKLARWMKYLTLEGQVIGTLQE